MGRQEHHAISHHSGRNVYDGKMRCRQIQVFGYETRRHKMRNDEPQNKEGRYYVSLEHLFKMYVEYTMYYNHRESQRKITSLEQMMADMKLEREEDRKYLRSLGISLEEVKDQNNTLIDETKGLKKQNKSIQHKLGIAVEDRAPHPEYMPYYTIRAQHGYTQSKMKIERVNFPDLEVLLDFRCSPNSKTLYVRIKAKGVTFRGNNIELCDSEVTEEEFVGEMKTINEKKYDV
jgi:hypothetical protein